MKPRIEQYMYSKRRGPKVPFKILLNKAHDLLFAHQQVLNWAWFLSRRSPSAMQIPSWSGFHTKLRSCVSVGKNIVGYLDCSDAPATEMSTVYDSSCNNY